MEPGDIHRSNFWGDVEVLEYTDSRNVVIRFRDTGYVLATNKDNILKGLVKDRPKSRQVAYEKALALNARLSARRVFAHHIRYLVATQVKLKSLNRIKSTIDLRHDYELSVFSKVYTSTEFGEYSAVRFIKGDTWLFQFKDSGNLVERRLPAASLGRIYDMARYSPDEVKARSRVGATRSYEKHREKRIASSSAYQRNNPEKSRNRNRRRRATRKGADGSYTDTEVRSLLLSQGNKCVACSVELDAGKHLDHIMPLILGGTNYIENLQWLCAFCNLTKNAKHPDVWLAEIITDEYQDRVRARL